MRLSLHKYFSFIGRKGGLSKSRKKIKAAKKNLIKARKLRHKK